MLGFRKSKKDLSSNIETVSRTEKKYGTSTDYSRDRSKDLIVKIKEMLLKSPDFFCELRGDEPDEHEYKIFIIEHALKTIWKHAKEGMPNGVGGILLGGLYRDPDKDEDYVEIHNAFPSASSFNEEMSLRVVNRVIADMEQVSLKTYPNQIVIGWYHTHPGKGIFFSENDVLIHETFYRETPNVALILDPLMEIDPLRETYKNIAFFYWKGRSVEKSSGYYAYKPRQLAESISPTDKLREKYHRRLALIKSAREQLPPTEVDIEEEENQYGDFLPQEDDDILFNAVRGKFRENPGDGPLEPASIDSGDRRSFAGNRNYDASEERSVSVVDERGSPSLLKGIKPKQNNKISTLQSVPKKRGLRVSPRNESVVPSRANEYLPSPRRDGASPRGSDRPVSSPYDMRFNEEEPSSHSEPISAFSESRRREKASSVSNYTGGIVRKSPGEKHNSPAPFRSSIRDFTSQPLENADDSSEGYLSEARKNKSSADEAREADSLYIEFDSSGEEAILDDEENEGSSPYEKPEKIQEGRADLRKETPSFSSLRRAEQNRKKSPSFVKTPGKVTDTVRTASPVSSKPVTGINNGREKDYVSHNYSKISSDPGNFITHTEGFSGREKDPEYDSFYNDIQILGGRNWRMEQKQVIHDPYEASSPGKRTKSGLLKAHKYKYYGNEEPSEEETGE
jgi:proteasome lid subunit RPN8/RPN11